MGVIAVGRPGSEIAENDERFYFAFESGRLSYDCVACGATCCRGHGYMLSGEQVLYQLSRRPALRFFLSGRGDGQTAVRNLAPGCFFLTDDNLCEIQVGDGYAAKPETCRLFPFNGIRRAGDYYIVAPHEQLCPLKIVSPGHQARESDHSVLLDAMREQGLRAVIPTARPIDADVAKLIRIERTICSLANEHLGVPYARFVAAQIAAGRTWDGSAEGDVARAQEQVDAFLVSAYSLLGLTPIEREMAAEEIDRVMTAMTPVLRSRCVFPIADDEHAGCYRGRKVEDVPFVLLAAYCLVRLAKAAGMSPITYQTVSRVWAEHHELITLMADVQKPMSWREDAEIDTSVPRVGEFHAPILSIAQALLPGKQGRRPRSVGDIVCERVMWTGYRRVQCLDVVARRLHGKLEPSLGRRGAGARWTPLGQRVARWALSNVEPNVLSQVIAKRQLRALTPERR